MILGIDFGGTKVAIATADSQGTIFEKSSILTFSERGAEQAVARALNEAHKLLQETMKRHPEDLTDVGVATMGITLEDRVLLSPNVLGWETLKLPSLLRQAFPDCRIHIENDVKSAAWAEILWGALDQESPGIFLNLGTGIALALTLGGQVLRGAHGASGEVAYCPRFGQTQEGIRHGHAPLEEYVGGGPIKSHSAEWVGETMSAGDLFRRAITDPKARAVVEPIIETIAIHLAQWVIAFDPARVVVGGGLVNVREVIFPVLNRVLHEFVPFPPELLPARFHREAGLHGALAIAVRSFDPHSQ